MFNEVTAEKIAKFNRALHPHVLEAAQQAGISPHHIVLNAVFLMPTGRTILCNLGPPLTEKEEMTEFRGEVVPVDPYGEGPMNVPGLTWETPMEDLRDARKRMLEADVPNFSNIRMRCSLHDGHVMHTVAEYEEHIHEEHDGKTIAVLWEYDN